MKFHCQGEFALFIVIQKNDFEFRNEFFVFLLKLEFKTYWIVTSTLQSCEIKGTEIKLHIKVLPKVKLFLFNFGLVTYLLNVQQRILKSNSIPFHLRLVLWDYYDHSFLLEI